MLGISDLEDRVIKLEEELQKSNKLIKRILNEGEKRFISMYGKYMWTISDNLLEDIKNEI